MTATRRIAAGLIASLASLAAFLLLGGAAMTAAAATPRIETEYAIARSHSATLEADINPQGADTTCAAEYVKQETWELSGYATAVPIACAPADLGAGSSPVTPTVALPGLEIDTTYHFRFLTIAEAVTEAGPDQTFATFGFATFSIKALNEAGEPEGRAGGVPYELETELMLNTTAARNGLVSPDVILKDLLTELPPGLIGNPTSVPPCPARIAEEKRCSGNSQVGQLRVSFGKRDEGGRAPIFEVAAPSGKAARLAGVVNLSTDAFIDASVRTGTDYGITAGAYNLTELADVYGATLRIWGVPASPLHNGDRSCPNPSGGYELGCASTAPEKPFLTMPTACTGPLTATARADAWSAPGEYVEASQQMPAITGCNKLQFNPAIEARPSTNAADFPSGLDVDIHVPQSPVREGGVPTLRCVPGQWSGAPSFAYRWLRSGAPIVGAEAAEYTETGADAGTAIQCEVEARNGAAGPVFAASQPVFPAPVAPMPPESGKAEIEGSITAAGGTVACNNLGGSAGGYRWFKDGVFQAGKTAQTYEVLAGEAPLALQCEVIEQAKSGIAAVAFSPVLESEPPFSAPLPRATLFPRAVATESEQPPLATPDLRDATVTLPQGVRLNPSAALGLGSCSEAQIELHGPDLPSCPNASKLGAVEVDTPLLGHSLPGSVYLATPHQNPFGSLLALYAVVEDPVSGVIVKLPGKVEANLQTGQLTTQFEEDPQLPFEDFHLRLFGGAEGALRTPSVCGTYKSTSVFTPWSAPASGAPAEPSDEFTLGGSCAQSEASEPNAPSFQAGTEAPQAGQFSPFAFRLSREDGSQEFSKIETVLPPGLTGKLAGVPYCPEAAIAAAKAREHEGGGAEEETSPSCPTASEVGRVEVGAGAGPDPYYTSGHAYLAGPYGGAPISLVTIVPAVAGPFDLGDVVTRIALHVDPFTTQIEAVSDPLPQIIDGIPLDARSITLKLDRPQFTLNPTSCDAMSIGGSAISALGQAAPLAERFQVGACNALPFRPHLRLALRGATKRAGFPALAATLTMKPGEADIARAQVTLPHFAFVANAHLDKTCSRPELESHSCPPRSIYGRARAWSPLLGAPLEGPVYLVTGYGYVLPALVADLNGQIEVRLVGKIDAASNHDLRNTFEVVPDAPISKFQLQMDGGEKGLIELSEPPCSKQTSRKAHARFTAHSGKVSVFEPLVRTSCKHGKPGHGNKPGHHRSGKGTHRKRVAFGRLGAGR